MFGSIVRKDQNNYLIRCSLIKVINILIVHLQKPFVNMAFWSFTYLMPNYINWYTATINCTYKGWFKMSVRFYYLIKYMIYLKIANIFILMWSVDKAMICGIDHPKNVLQEFAAHACPFGEVGNYIFAYLIFNFVNE